MFWYVGREIEEGEYGSIGRGGGEKGRGQKKGEGRDEKDEEEGEFGLRRGSGEVLLLLRMKRASRGVFFMGKRRIWGTNSC